MPGRDQPVCEKEITFEESIHFQEFPLLNESEDILVLVDEAHRSHTRTLHRNLRKALPNAVIIGFTGTPILSKEKTETREIFGEFIDKYILQDAELDGATVPILYEGRTADGLVKDAPGLDQLFEDLFRDYSPDELAIIKAKYATEGYVLEAPLLIEQKARDMIRHYVGECCLRVSRRRSWPLVARRQSPTAKSWSRRGGSWWPSWRRCRPPRWRCRMMRWRISMQTPAS